MKIEFLHHWQRAARPARSRDRLIAHLPRWAPWAVARSVAAQPARSRCPGARALAERMAGLSARRSLPRWRRDTFLRDMAHGARRRRRSPDVVLFVDTFTNYFEPENAHAALAVLRAAGYRVASRRAAPGDAEAARPLCCGRTYLARGPGRRGEARSAARRRRAGAARGARRDGRRSRAVVPAVAARRVPGAWVCGDAAQRLARRRVADRGVPGARARAPAGSRLPLGAAAAEARAGARPLPPEGVRRAAATHATCCGSFPVSPSSRSNRAAAAWPAASATKRALRRVDAHGRGVAAARRARRHPRHARRRRRHELPPPDRRRDARERTRRRAAPDMRLERALVRRTRRPRRADRGDAVDRPARRESPTPEPAMSRSDRRSDRESRLDRGGNARRLRDAGAAVLGRHARPRRAPEHRRTARGDRRHAAVRDPGLRLRTGTRPLRALRERGHDPIGLDGTPRFVAMARDYSACEVWQQDFLSLALPDGPLRRDLRQRDRYSTCRPPRCPASCASCARR